MLFQNKKNPVFELQKKLDKEKIMIGQIVEDDKFETNDKMVFGVIEKIYNFGKETVKKDKLTNKIFWAFCGFAGGCAIVLMLFFTRILKP